MVIMDKFFVFNDNFEHNANASFYFYLYDLIKSSLIKHNLNNNKLQEKKI